MFDTIDEFRDNITNLNESIVEEFTNGTVAINRDEQEGDKIKISGDEWWMDIKMSDEKDGSVTERMRISFDDYFNQ